MQKDYLLTENPMKAIFIFSLPMVIGNLFQQFYNMADSMVVGRYVSENALAAVGASSSLTNVFICIAIGGGVGASVFTSRYFGARQYRRMRLCVSTALLSFLVLSITLALLGFFFGRSLLVLLNTPEELLDMALEYMNIYFLGLPFLFMYNVLSSMFNALGRSRIPLYLLIFSSVFNVVLDVYLVRAWNMGIAGVAWATLIAQGISALLSFIIFLRVLRGYPREDEGISQTGSGRFFSRLELGLMSRVALPSILQQSTVSIGLLLVQSVVNSFGASALAGYSAGARVESICIVPMAAFGNAMSSYVAQNLGAIQADSEDSCRLRIQRVRQGLRASLCLAAISAVILCVVLEGFHTQIIASFLGADSTGTSLKVGSSYIQFTGFFFFLIGLKMSIDGLLRGAADMTMFTVANLVNLTFRVSFAVIMAPRFGINMVWYAVPIGWFLNFLISFTEYRTGKWMQQKGKA